jgi:hypothetical protein
MPIRFVDRSSTIVARIAVTLANHAAALAGTFTAAASRTGSIAAQMQNHASAFVGLSQANANRVGTIGVTLTDMAAAFSGATPGSLSLLESDWQARTGGAAVVWMHDFRSDNEVNAFRWTPTFGSGNDPSAIGGALAPLVRRITSDGITGACLEIVRPAGTGDGSVWWRPFSPIQGGTTTGNGRGAGQNDPGASGLSTPITAKAYTATSGGGQVANWAGGGWYGTDTSGPGGASEFDGADYYLQVRVKMDPNRIAGGNAAEDVGKLFYFTRNDRSATDQEIVTFSGHAISSRNYFSMYRSVSPSLASDPPGVATHGDQPGTAFGAVGNGVCRFDNNGGRLANCWAWPATAQWVTMLWHVRNGTNGGGNTLVRVFVAEEGATKYTKIWDQPGVDLPFDADHPFGHNALICSIYHNGDSMPVQFYHRYSQMVFSRDFIPCPQIYGTSGSALALASYGLASNASATFTPGLSFSMDEADMAWQSLFYYDTRNNLIQVMGKRANAGTQWKLRTYNVSTGVWTVNDPTAINRDGHIYGIFTIDPATGNLYLMPGSTPADRALYRFVPSGNSGTWSIVADPLWSGALNMPADGLGWHPHLYGTNGGGCITSAETSGTSQTAAIYKASNNAIQNVSVGSFDSGRFYGQGVYFPKINKVVFGGGSHLHVNATTASGTPTFTAVGAPPIPTKGDTMDNTGFGTMMVHPGNPQKMLLIERGGSRRTWTSTDGDSWTQTGTHPFIQPAYALCSCAPLGTVWALGATGTDPGTPYSVLWKPPV